MSLGLLGRQSSVWCAGRSVICGVGDVWAAPSDWDWWEGLCVGGEGVVCVALHWQEGRRVGGAVPWE